ncbi:MAG TPA: hypothetical protein VMV77_04615 [Bacteroidales bacterium]|nr:hypothetical protein [Bacteroidales bacterium]
MISIFISFEYLQYLRMSSPYLHLFPFGGQLLDCILAGDLDV